MARQHTAPLPYTSANEGACTRLRASSSENAAGVNAGGGHGHTRRHGENADVTLAGGQAREKKGELRHAARKRARTRHLLTAAGPRLVPLQGLTRRLGINTAPRIHSIQQTHACMALPLPPT